MPRATKFNDKSPRVKNSGGYYQTGTSRESASRRSQRYASGMDLAARVGDAYRSEHFNADGSPKDGEDQNNHSQSR